MTKAIKNRRKPIAQVEGYNFDKENHVHSLDGRPLYGVTSILRVISKPALLPWAARCVADHIRETCAWIQDGLTERVYTVKESDLELAIKAHTKKKESAGTAGTGVHEEIERLVKEQIATNGGLFASDTKMVIGSDMPQVQKFITWARDNKVRFLESEKYVYSRESWYGGICDLVLEMDGKKYIADVKTSSGIYPEFYLQMAAYQGALEEMGEHTDITGAMVINLDKRGGFEIGMNYAYEDNRMAFLAALILYKQLNSIK